MLGKCFSVISIASILYAAVTGTLPVLSAALLEGAARGVEITLSLLGMTALWCGFLRVLTACGALSRMAQLLKPLLSLAFPRAFREGLGAEEITACVSANLLGVANAATPIAMSAMEKLGRDTDGEATPDMITLVLLSASGVSLFPSTIIALRQGAGAAMTTAILPPVWIASLCGAVISVFLSRLCAAAFRKKG